METNQDRGRIGEDVARNVRLELVPVLNDREYSVEDIAYILRLPESVVQEIVGTEDGINWGYNCLTAGIHHGRPEALWNLPLLYAATVLFGKDALKTIVISRIYNDAMQYAKAGTDPVRYDAAWAQRVADHAEEYYDRTLQHKVGELSEFYKKARPVSVQLDVAERVKNDSLNPHYEPLHSHDSINLLCRILGSSASRAVS